MVISHYVLTLGSPVLSHIMSQRHCSIRLDVKGKIVHFVSWDTVSPTFLQMSNRLSPYSFHKEN